MERDEQGVIWQGTGSARQVVPQTKCCGCRAGEVPKREADGKLWAGTGSGREVVSEIKRWVPAANEKGTKAWDSPPEFRTDGCVPRGSAADEATLQVDWLGGRRFAHRTNPGAATWRTSGQGPESTGDADGKRVVRAAPGRGALRFYVLPEGGVVPVRRGGR